MKKSFSRGPAYLILASFIILFFLPYAFKSKIPIPADSLLGLYHPFRDNSYSGYNKYQFPVKNSLITDPVIQIYPWKKTVVDNFKNKSLPLWNPYSFSGQPLAANIQSSPFFFLNLLFFVMPFNIAWGIQIIIVTLLAGVFMYLFLSEKISITSAIFASFLLPLAGSFLAWMTWSNIVATAMWLPLILLSIEKIFKKVESTWFLVLTFAASQTIFAGHWQIAAYAFLASIAYLIFTQIQVDLNRNIIPRESLGKLSVIILAFTLGFFICAIQIIPSLEFIENSARSADQSYYPGRQDWFLPPQNLIQLVAPDFFGNPATQNYWGIWNYAEFVTYIGILPLYFAILSLIKRPKIAMPLFFIGGFSLILALSNPISKIPYLFKIPFIASSQPSRVVFILVFSLVALSGFGLNYFLKEKNKKILLIPALTIFILCFCLLLLTFFFKNIFPAVDSLNPSQIALRNLILPIVLSLITIFIVILKIIKIPRKLLILIIFAVTISDVFRFAYKFTPFTQTSQVFPRTAITDYLKVQERPFRIMSTDRRILHPNISAVYRAESVDGYDPLFLKNYAQFISSIQSESFSTSLSFNRIVTPQNYDPKILSLLNIKYIASFDEMNNSSLEKILEEGQTKLYQNKSFIPRAFFVNEVKKVDTKEQEYKILLSSDFNPRISAVSQEVLSPYKEDFGSVHFLSYGDQSFSLKTENTDMAPLIVSNINYPGWNALIDSLPAHIYEVNTSFQAVIVPGGSHVIDFAFKPQSFYNGAYISIAALVIAILLSFILWIKKFR